MLDEPENQPDEDTPVENDDDNNDDSEELDLKFYSEQSQIPEELRKYYTRANSVYNPKSGENESMWVPKSSDYDRRIKHFRTSSYDRKKKITEKERDISELQKQLDDLKSTTTKTKKAEEQKESEMTSLREEMAELRKENAEAKKQRILNSLEKRVRTEFNNRKWKFSEKGFPILL